MGKKARATPEEIADQSAREGQFFDKWLNRFTLTSAFGAVVAGSTTAAVVFAAPVAVPVAGGIAVGFGAFFVGSKVVSHFRHDKSL